MLTLLAGVAGLWALASGLPGQVGGAVARAYYGATADAGLTVQNIMVEGRVNTDPARLLRTVGFRRGDALMAFDPDSVRRKLERDPWIRSARVERRLPDTIYVSLTERVPAALWQNQGRLSLIDEEGTVLTNSDLERFSDYLIVVGQDAPGRVADLTHLLQGEPSIRNQVEAATLAGGRRWDLRLKSGLTVRLPEDDPGLALSRLARAQDQEGIMDKDLTAIDLRDRDRIIVATRPGAAQSYKTSSGAGDNI